MRKLISTLFFISLALFVQAQNMYRPSEIDIQNAPSWAQMMYADNPNVLAVDKAYRTYFENFEFEKSYHTQYYKRWRRSVDDYIQPDGTAIIPTSAQLKRINDDYAQLSQSGARSGNWSLVGPVVSFNGDGEKVSQQTNVFCLDQSESDLGRMYCGTEPGEIYASNDGGETWANVSLDFQSNSGVRSIEIHPTNPDIVYAGVGNYIFKSTNGGASWDESLYEDNLHANEILINTLDPNIVMAATDQGVFRSTNGGADWSNPIVEKAYDLKLNTADANIVYLLKHNASLNICSFFKSTDMGATFSVQTDGWYSSTDPNRNDGGARLAVTQADANRVYAYLIGEAKANDNGYIGLYRSNDGGETWTLPNGPTGGPYNDNHANLAIGYPDWQYHQGFYNCALAASHTDPDEILLGGLNLYTSDDGGDSFYPLAGYVGGDYNIHVDMQDFRSIGNTTWVTTDGGIYRSDDFFNSDAFESKMYGIHGSDFWGFGSGWNEDVLIGGLYHNGNTSFLENYGAGNFLQLGGGEPASGYVNQGENRRVYSSDINGKIMPNSIGEPIESVGFGIDPNEAYYSVESSELEFDPRCYATAYTGKENQLWKTEDKGTTFTLFAEFGNNPDNEITYIEPSWSNTDVMYVAQQIFSPSQNGILWKTTDGGLNWTQTNLPAVGNKRKMLVQVDPLDENIVWIAFATTTDGQRVYKSTDGGNAWTNLTSASLDGHQPRSLNHIGGTDGGVYLATNRSIFYKNNSMSEWEDFGDGLPLFTNTCIARPFYRDGKIRTASYGKGIWESALYEAPSRPVAQIMVDKLSTVYHCTADTFHYVDHSMLNHQDATWEWTFQGGTPASANGWNADVSYADAGTYLTILTVTNGAGVSDTDSLYIEVLPYIPAQTVSEDFETIFPPAGFEIVNADEDITWEQETGFGAYGNSNQCMRIRGFDYWPGGDEDDIKVSLDMSASLIENPYLTFDVAYAQYADNYTDSLEVLVSLDCGITYTSLYFKGGAELATAPNFGESPFIPTASEWRTDSLSFANYVEDDVMVVFRSHTGWGQNVYVDNINLGDISVGFDNTDSHSEEMVIYPNPIANGEMIFIDTDMQETILVELYNMEGKRIYKKNHKASDGIALPEMNSGVYLFVLSASTRIQKGKLVVN